MPNALSAACHVIILPDAEFHQRRSRDCHLTQPAAVLTVNTINCIYCAHRWKYPICEMSVGTRPALFSMSVLLLAGKETCQGKQAMKQGTGGWESGSMYVCTGNGGGGGEHQYVCTRGHGAGSGENGAAIKEQRPGNDDQGMEIPVDQNNITALFSSVPVLPAGPG